MAEQGASSFGPDSVGAPVVVMTGICKNFSQKNSRTAALRDITLSAEKGKVTGLVGMDGAGKTTLLRIAAGLLLPSGGTVSVLGLDPVSDTQKIQAAIGYMPQKFGLYQDLSVQENLDLYSDLQGIPKDQRPERHTRLLEMTGLRPFTARRAGALSGGMKQKLGLACALIKSPRLLLLDEPTVGVDPVSRRELWKIINQLVQQDNIGVLVSTAYLDEAERCDTVIILHEGEILASGPPKMFSQEKANHVFILSPEAPTTSRRLHACCTADSSIVDSTIRSGRVRVVLNRPADARSPLLLETARKEGLGFHSVEGTPTFEDAFMAMVQEKREQQAWQENIGKASVKASTPPRIPSSNTAPPIRVAGLNRFFGSFHAVRDLHFTVNSGEIFGLLGPNGAGKSTTFRILCGLLPASNGTIEVAGYNLRTSRARARRRLGYMAQQFSLYGQLSVKENLLFFGKAYGLYGKALTERLQWAYDEFDLGSRRETPAGTLPGGYKQRLAMAAALLHRPDILFLDEPTSGVDPFARREFWLRITSFAEAGVTVIVTTHFMEEAEYCDRMLIMSQGETLAAGTPAEIRAMARTLANPEPSMDDAFIFLAQNGTPQEDAA